MFIKDKKKLKNQGTQAAEKGKPISAEKPKKETKRKKNI